MNDNRCGRSYRACLTHHQEPARRIDLDWQKRSDLLATSRTSLMGLLIVRINIHDHWGIVHLPVDLWGGSSRLRRLGKIAVGCRTLRCKYLRPILTGGAFLRRHFLYHLYWANLSTAVSTTYVRTRFKDARLCKGQGRPAGSCQRQLVLVSLTNCYHFFFWIEYIISRQSEKNAPSLMTCTSSAMPLLS